MRRLILLGAIATLVGCAQPSQPSLGHPSLDGGRVTYNKLCAACHGGNGQGNSAPALNGVLETFPDCSIHLKWIFLGSKKWQEQVGETYGETDKEITAVMPSFETSLSTEQIAQVAAFERFQFGGASIEQAVDGCGV